MIFKAIILLKAIYSIWKEKTSITNSINNLPILIFENLQIYVISTNYFRYLFIRSLQIIDEFLKLSFNNSSLIKKKKERER